MFFLYNSVIVAGLRITGSRILDPGSWILGILRIWNPERGYEVGTKLVRMWYGIGTLGMKLVRSWKYISPENLVGSLCTCGMFVYM